MLITVEEMKKYLRVDSADDDALIRQLMETSEKMVADVSRRNAGELDEISEVAKTAGAKGGLISRRGKATK